jgi:hypothetical protein
MGKLVATLTFLACAVGLVSLLRAIGLEITSEPGILIAGDAWGSASRATLSALLWAAILLLPILVAGFLAHRSRTSLLLGSIPFLLMLWILAWINGFGLMVWHPLDPRHRNGGMSFNFELSLLGIVYLWPPALICVAVWTTLRRWLRPSAADKTPTDPTRR